MALSVYLFVAVASAVALVWRHPLAEIAAAAAAPIGAAFTFVCLATGSLVGPPDVGRLVGLGCAADLGAGAVLSLSRLHRAGERVRRCRAVRRGAGSVLALAGVVNLPIIKFSVDWWNTLHQPASVVRLGGPKIDVAMLIPLLVMAAGLFAVVRGADDAAHADRT